MEFKLKAELDDLDRLAKVLKERTIKPTGTHIKKVDSPVSAYLLAEPTYVMKRSIYIDNELQEIINK